MCTGYKHIEIVWQTVTTSHETEAKELNRLFVCRYDCVD